MTLKKYESLKGIDKRCRQSSDIAAFNFLQCGELRSDTNM